MWQVDCADILDWCKGYDGEKFHALLTDSPYSLHFMGKDWDRDIAFQPDTWLALSEHLHPGAFGMSFASSRGWHRLACAIEDAGLIIHPSIFMLGWVQGQGFPKATRIMVDGKEPEEWSGHRYGLQAMKPALEPIILFQKPYDGKPVDCITSTGAGALNIDRCRVGYQGTNDWHGAYGGNSGSDSRMPGWGMKARPQSENINPSGRWPPNVLLSHVPPRPDGNGGWLPGCERVGVKQIRYRGGKPNQEEGHTYTYGWANCSIFKKGHIPANPDGTEQVDDWVCIEGCPVRALEEQSGQLKSGHLNPLHTKKQNQVYGAYQQANVNEFGANSGTAARFYPQFGWQYEIAERLAGVVPFKYQAKSSRSERDAGLEEFKERQRRTMGHGLTGISGDRSGNGKQEPLPMGEGKIRNHHPTVKPIELCKWLCSLLAPPPEYAPRRLLIPFAGSGSEISAAILSQNFEEIVGIEMEEEYVRIAEARCHFWETTMKEIGSSDPRAILKTYGKKGKTKQDSEGHSHSESHVQMSLGI